MQKSSSSPDAAAPGGAVSDGLPTPRRHLAVLTVWMAMVMSVLDGVIANVALPTMARDLQADAAASIWIVNAYQLAVTVSILPFAALGDRLGYRRVYLAGLAAFTLASVACALSPSLSWLVAARVAQGLGAAAVMSLNGAMVRFIFPERMLGRGLGVNAVVIAISSAIGPTVAGAVLGVAGWPWLFAINIPFGVAAMAIGWRALPTNFGARTPFDWISAALNAVAFGFLILGAESIASEGPANGLAKIAIGAAAAVALIIREWRRANPLIPIDLLRIPAFALSTATSALSFSAQMAAFVVLPFYLQAVLGRSVVETGLLITPWPLAVGVAAAVSGRLADRHSAAVLGGVGLSLFAAGLFALSLIGPGTSTPDIVWRMALCGLGFGVFQSPNNRTIMTSAPRARSGAAGGALATARVLGQTAGAAAMGIAFHLGGLGASKAALAGAALVAALSAVVSLTRLRVRT